MFSSQKVPRDQGLVPAHGGSWGHGGGGGGNGGGVGGMKAHYLCRSVLLGCTHWCGFCGGTCPHRSSPDRGEEGSYRCCPEQRRDGAKIPLCRAPKTNAMRHAQGCAERGCGEGGVWDSKVCVPKMARPEFSNGKFRLFPRWSLWSGGGGVQGGGGDLCPKQKFITALDTSRWRRNSRLGPTDETTLSGESREMA